MTENHAQGTPLFDTVLVANRGEIAVRVIRTLRRLGIRSVAVHSDADADARHVREADTAVRLGPAPARESYLDIDAVVDAARRTGAQAVHPGYGFLSENADFARALDAAGIVFVGPPVASLDAMADKIRAKETVAAYDVPVVPGIQDPTLTDEQITAEAERVGFPLLIKPSAGGGGKGMVAVRAAEELPGALASARRTARSAFGDDTLLLERLITAPRHIEVQVFADAHGATVHLGERECSLQRRHQKVIEEAPAPLLTGLAHGAELRERLGRAAVDAAVSVGYRGAGTVEFLVSDENPDEFFFMEMNTRLQVEHPVSEEITGIDLVREQFRLARGEALGYTDPQPRGHSIEFRLNGEDPGRNFLPAPGRLTTFRMPSGPGVRVDSGVVEGEAVSGAFDSMVAKLIVTGADRRQALQRAARALREAEIVGMPSVLPFHRAVVRDPAFAPEIAGSEEPFSVHTRWIETEFANHIEPSALTPAEPAPREARHTVTVEVNGKRVDVTLPTWGEALHTISGAAQRAGAGRRRPRGKRGAPVAAAVSTDALTAPMQGTVVKVAAENGQTVAEGDLIVVVEAMKMEQPLAAHRAGVVSGLEVEPGQTVTAGTVIATIADAE